MYLTDDDLVASLKRAAQALNISDGKSGLIFVKENIKSRDFIVDKTDNSVTRSLTYFNKIFTAAGLKIIHSSLQPNWPQSLYDLNMWVLTRKNSIE